MCILSLIYNSDIDLNLNELPGIFKECRSKIVVYCLSFQVFFFYKIPHILAFKSVKQLILDISEAFKLFIDKLYMTQDCSSVTSNSLHMTNQGSTVTQ